jgi:predicted nucleotidyltransferase
LSDLLGRRVDLATPGGLQPFARPSALRDAVRVF